ncbi:uncharacterized protein LOC117105020 isoform X2 [Anneissia japonica]|uniref:uncharacterized protein LOC117105020 isoform X2 n=1 Tax=Anneissia japonica TaxID=1529436 RepID=UPI001425B282|nr:uncharacterized protein LOC117105020 isoform X2 [Anneissia japonica]
MFLRMTTQHLLRMMLAIVITFILSEGLLNVGATTTEEYTGTMTVAVTEETSTDYTYTSTYFDTSMSASSITTTKTKPIPTTMTTEPMSTQSTSTTTMDSTTSPYTTTTATTQAEPMGSTTQSITTTESSTAISTPMDRTPTSSSTAIDSTTTAAATTHTVSISTETKSNGTTQSITTTESSTTISTPMDRTPTSSSTAIDSTTAAAATTHTVSISTEVSTGMVTNTPSAITTTNKVTPTKWPKKEAIPDEVLTVVNVTMYVIASNVAKECADAPSIAKCPNLTKEFKKEFGEAYSEFDPKAYHRLVVTDISSFDKRPLKAYTTEEQQLNVDHYVEYKYTKELDEMSVENFTKEVFRDETYGSFTYNDSFIVIDTDFCNEEYYYPCEDSFKFRCNDENKPECASKCEDSFNWCHNGSCSVGNGGEISCKCTSADNFKYTGSQCDQLECESKGDLVYYGDTCDKKSCYREDKKWYIGKDCQFPVNKIWLIVGLSVGGALFLFMITLVICLSCKRVGRRKDEDDLEDSVDNSIISAYEDERHKLSSPMLSGVKNPTYLHDEGESGDSIHKDRPFSYFQPSSPVDPYYSNTTFGYGNDGPSIFPPDDPNSEVEMHAETEQKPTHVFTSDLAQTNKKNVKKQQTKSTDKKKKSSKQANESKRGKSTVSPVFDYNEDIMYLEENTLWSPELLSKMKQPISIKRAEPQNMDAYNYPDADY